MYKTLMTCWHEMNISVATVIIIATVDDKCQAFLSVPIFRKESHKWAFSYHQKQTVQKSCIKAGSFLKRYCSTLLIQRIIPEHIVVLWLIWKKYGTAPDNICCKTLIVYMFPIKSWTYRWVGVLGPHVSIHPQVAAVTYHGVLQPI